MQLIFIQPKLHIKSPIEFWERVDLVFKGYNQLALFWEAVVNSVVELRATAAARTGCSDRVALRARCV